MSQPRYPRAMIPRWYSRLLVLNIIVQSGIIVTGAIVRVTASGLGCPTWPECVDGSITPTDEQTEAFHKYIEFGNRTLTGVLMLVAIAVFVATLRRFRSPRIRVLAAAPLLGTLAQAVLGGITVLTGLNPWIVASHFLLSIVLVELSVRLWWQVHHSAVAQSAFRTLIARVLVTSAASVIVVGTLVTGSGPHSGDSADVGRMDFDPRIITWLHADLVWLFVGIVIAVAVLLKTQSASKAAWRSWQILAATVIAQGALGYVQHFSGLPVVLVATHVLGAVIMWNVTLVTARHVEYSIWEH